MLVIVQGMSVLEANILMRHLAQERRCRIYLLHYSLMQSPQIQVRHCAWHIACEDLLFRLKWKGLSALVRP